MSELETEQTTDLSERVPIAERVAFDAAIEAINRTRRTLVVMIALVCLGAFHQYNFYFSWAEAQIVAREATATALETLGGDRSRTNSATLATGLRAEAAELRNERLRARIEVPIIGLEVGSSDFSVAIQMIGVAVLLWLIFNQVRLNETLTRLDTLTGWGVPLMLLELHFGLIGSQGSRLMKLVGRLLPLAMPLLSLVFVYSDVRDVLGFAADPVRGLAFSDSDYQRRVFVRLGTVLSLTCFVVALGIWSFREWLRTEEWFVQLATAKEGPRPARLNSVRD